MNRTYPADVAGPYDSPPCEFRDQHDREISIARYDGEFDSLVQMYRKYNPEDRAQGIPPTNDEAIREWLETLVGEDATNVVAWHHDDLVGHALLVADRNETYELAIFVQREYQAAGIGTRLMKGLLGAGREDGIEYVWLTVERWNTPAIAVYEKVGFERCENGGFELEMTARLQPPDATD